MSKHINLLMLIYCLIFSPFTVAANTPLDIKPFYASSMENILASRQGKPFILGLWSLACTHCRDDLALLSAMSQQHPEMDLVLIATDSIDEADRAAATLGHYSFGKMDYWIFADDFIEKLQYNIDRQWHGELPRTYFYNASHQMRAFSGKLDAVETERWIKEQYRH